MTICRNLVKVAPFLTLSLVLLLPGCSSTPTQVNKGPIRAATFSFVAASRPETDFAEKREAIHQMIQQAITQNLSGKGLRKTESGGDVTVAYLVIVGNNASIESINTYFGYGRDTTALDNKAFSAYTKSKNPNYFEAGTLIIDVIDSRTFKLLDRNYVVRPILRNPSSEVRESHIQEAVNEALKDLRVAQ